MMRHKNDRPLLSRRNRFSDLGAAPLLFFVQRHSTCIPSLRFFARAREFLFALCRHPPQSALSCKSPLADVLRFVPPGSDEYASEKYAVDIEALLKQWASDLRASPRDLSSFASMLDASIEGCSLARVHVTAVRSGFGIDVVKRQFAAGVVRGREPFVHEIASWLRELPMWRPRNSKFTRLKKLPPIR